MSGHKYPPPESYPPSQFGYPPPAGYGPPPPAGYGPLLPQYAQGYVFPGAYPSPYPPAGYHPSPYPPSPQQAQAYYAAQGRQLFVQAMQTPVGGPYMSAPPPARGDYDMHKMSQHNPNGFTLN